MAVSPSGGGAAPLPTDYWFRKFCVKLLVRVFALLGNIFLTFVHFALVLCFY